MTDTDFSDKRLESISGNVRLAAQGDEAAFSRLIDENAGMLYRVSRSILKSDADAADAVQDAVITAWRRIGQLRCAASFPAWIARICVHRCYRIARKRKQAAELYEPVGSGFCIDERLDVMRALADLPDTLRLTAVFYYFEDWDVKTIARSFGIMQGTVKSRLHRARKLLEAKLMDNKEE